MAKKIWSEKKKEQIMDLFDYWLNEFLIVPCSIQIEYHLKSQDPDDSESVVAMDIHYLNPYRSVDINIYPEALEFEDDSFERLIIHEVMHGVLRKLIKHREAPDNYSKELEEEVCEILSWRISKYHSMPKK